jgi:sugar lactone lactonase YvrE
MTRLCDFPHAQDVTATGAARIRANDAKVSPRGTAYLGSMPYDPVGDAGTAALYVLHGDQLRKVLSGITISNGMGWSPDGSTMYYIDSPTGRIDRCVGDGLTSAMHREPFVDIDPTIGVPDGMCVDAEGFLWVAIWGGGRVMRFAPDGSAAGQIEVPCPQVTSCTFAGPDLRTLVITTAAEGLAPQAGYGMTYAVEAEVTGQPQPLLAT